MELYPAGPPTMAAIPHSRPLELGAETDSHVNDDARIGDGRAVHCEDRDGWYYPREGRLIIYPRYPAIGCRPSGSTTTRGRGGGRMIPSCMALGGPVFADHRVAVPGWSRQPLLRCGCVAERDKVSTGLYLGGG